MNNQENQRNQEQTVQTNESMFANKKDYEDFLEYQNFKNQQKTQQQYGEQPLSEQEQLEQTQPKPKKSNLFWLLRIITFPLGAVFKLLSWLLEKVIDNSLVRKALRIIGGLAGFAGFAFTFLFIAGNRVFYGEWSLEWMYVLPAVIFYAIGFLFNPFGGIDWIFEKLIDITDSISDFLFDI